MVELILSGVVLLVLILCAPGLKRGGVRGMVLIALLSALASAGRAAFAAVPSVQPASFIIIVCGACLGGGAGFVCGVLTAVLSSLLTSIGPWTIWQALLWGLMGLFAARLAHAPLWVLGLFGLASGFVFGWVMNLWYYTMGIVPLTVQTFIAACASSFPFDMAHALTNFALLTGFGKYFMAYLKKMARGQGTPF